MGQIFGEYIMTEVIFHNPKQYITWRFFHVNNGQNLLLVGSSFSGPVRSVIIDGKFSFHRLKGVEYRS